MKTFKEIDIKYYDNSGNVQVRCTVPVTQDALVHYELMQSHYCKLSFKLSRPTYFLIGDFIETPYGRFELIDLTKAKDNDTVGYSYEIQFDAYYRKLKNKILKYRPNTGSQEATFSLTSKISTHIEVIMKNLAYYAKLDKSYLYDPNFEGEGTDYTYVIDASVDANAAKLITYSNSSILDAIANIAQTFGCEWWFEGNILHFGTCENTNAITDFRLNDNIVSMSSSQSKSTYANRVYAFGAARNLPSGYKNDSDADITKDGVVEKRLMLPTSAECSEQNKQMLAENGFELKNGYIQVCGLREDQYVEGVTTNDDIYPRNLIKTSKVTSYEKDVEDESTPEEGDYIKRTFYRVNSLTIVNDYGEKTGDMDFRKAYILSGKNLHIVFQSGSLNGMDFECEFNPDGVSEILKDDDGNPILKDGKEQINPKSQVFEIVANEDYGRFLPDITLHPKDGDTFVLYNWDSTKLGDTLVSSASNELLTDSIKDLKKSMVDPTTYTCTAEANYSYNHGRGNLHGVGDRVNLYNKGYGDGYRSSRVIGYEFSLDIPFDGAKYYVGEKPSYSRLNAMESKIEELIYNGQSYLNGNGGSGRSIYIIKSYDSITPTDYNVFSAKAVDEQRLNKTKDDTANGTITFEKVQKLLGGLLVGENFSFDKEGNILAHSISSDGASEENGKGFTILQKDPLTNTYKLCIDEVIAYTVATVGKLFVNGNSRFGGELSSKQFISGFLGGLGWGIYNTPVTNAAGVQENKWTGEFDNVIVRGSLRVFEMIISQLLGENDNRIFTGMMEVDHYDAESGRVYLNTQDGKLYNPFRRNDIIMVQQFNGMPNSSNDYYVTKNYELLITDAGCGSLEDGDKRLDWVTFTNFTSSMEGATAESLIKKKDTFVRVDNLSDSQRKGIIQLMTVGANTPYMDIIYGLKTDPNNALKGRLGNLKGIVHPILGELSGFGEFLNNLYAVGDFIIQRTGESVDSKLQVLENMFSSRFSQTSYELTNSDNYLENGQFLEQVRDDEDTIISCWAVDTTDESMFWADALGNPFMVNGLLSVSGNRKVSIDKMDGRQVLRLQNCGVKQLNAHIRQPGTHKEYQQPSGSTGDNGLKKPATGSTDVQDRLYISIRIFAKTAGTLTVGFEGCSSVSGKSNTLTAQNVAVPYSGDWTNIPLEGVWNGTGNFVLRYTGDCYIAIASITDKPLSEFSKSVSTQIKQTATNIQLLGENIDSVNGTTTQLGIDLDAEKKSIRIYVDETDKANRTFTTSGIEASVGKVQAWVKNLDYATNTTVTSKVEILSGRITSTVSKVNANSTSITNIQQDIDTITQTVGQAATKEQLKENVATLNRAIDSARSHADDVGTGIRNDYASTITLVKQSSSSWSVAAGGFDSNGKLKSSAGAVLNTDFAGLFVSQVNEKGLVNKGQMNIAISNGISTATIQADQINLTGHTMAFTGGQITITTDNFTLDGSGNMWCKNGTFSGMVSGVHGSFKNLDCVDNNGNVVGSIKFGSDGRLWFSGDMYHQGYDNAKKRNYRFYAADILCRGMFGHRQKTVAYVFNTYMAIYTNDSDDMDHYVMISLESGTESGKTYNKIPLYGFADYGDASGFAIDVVVINSSSDFYYVFEGMGNGKEWRVINGNDKKTIHFADIGGWHELKGGESLSCVYVVPRLLSPTPSGLGAGVFWSGEADLNWS